VLRRDLYPFESRYLSIQGLRCHYVDEGQGPAVLMLHGNPSWSFYYRDLIRALRPSYRVIAPDHIGMGLSEKPDDSRYPYTAARRIDDLGRLVEHLGLRSFTLVGHDWGGILGTAFATAHPELIDGMVILNTAGFNWPVGKRLPLALHLARLPLASALFIRGLNVFARGAVSIGVKRGRMRREVAEGLLHPYGTWADRISVHRFVQDIPVRPGDRGWDLALEMESRLKLLREVPKLICWGMKDFVFCPKMLDEWLRHFPDAEVHRFEDAGHYVLEDAADEVIPLVRTFLDSKVRDRFRAPGPRPVPLPPQAPAAGDVVDLAARLAERIRREPAAPVVAEMKGTGPDGAGRYATLTFEEAERRSSRIAHGLEKVGLRRGARVVVMVTPGAELFAILLALLEMGAIPVLVDPGMGLKRLGTCLDEARPEAFVGVPRAQVARLLFRWARGSLKLVVTVGRRAAWGGHTLAQIEALGSPGPYVVTQRPAPDDVAMIAYTSGNTGPPKGVVYTHRMLAAQLEHLEGAVCAARGGAHLATFPPFALLAPACGLPAVIPAMDATRPIRADPERLVAAIRDRRCASSFLSPALVEKLGRHCEARGVTLAPLRLVVSAGAPARLSSLARFVKALPPGAEVLLLYGATEGLPLASIGSAELLASETRRRTAEGGGVCVGRPVPGVELAIVAITDDPIPTWSDALRLAPGAIGEIVARGPVVSPAYLALPEHDRLAKIGDPRDGGLWHRMGDVGSFDEEGRLWMCGRKGHRVVTPERTHFSIPCEAVFETHPQVDRAALVGVTRGGRLEPVICIQPHARLGRAARRRLTGELLALGAERAHTRDIRTVLYHSRFPLDVRHNAKIAREQLARWAQERLR
jgi:acyl-CoA synthetase (AMP-forming)/AMP-acid ligase II/pimeloyl-ACP methyl ester carboxylesterase